MCVKYGIMLFNERKEKRYERKKEYYSSNK